MILAVDSQKVLIKSYDSHMLKYSSEKNYFLKTANKTESSNHEYWLVHGNMKNKSNIWQVHLLQLKDSGRVCAKAFTTNSGSIVDIKTGRF